MRNRCVLKRLAVVIAMQRAYEIDALWKSRKISLAQRMNREFMVHCPRMKFVSNVPRFFRCDFAAVYVGLLSRQNSNTIKRSLVHNGCPKNPARLHPSHGRECVSLWCPLRWSRDRSPNWNVGNSIYDDEKHPFVARWKCSMSVEQI